MSSAAYQKIHAVINPASGKDEPIINTFKDVFHQHSVEWEEVGYPLEEGSIS